jgi:hypothetical protein
MGCAPMSYNTPVYASAPVGGSATGTLCEMGAKICWNIIYNR